MDVLQCMYKRRSIRKYSDEPVNDDTLITLIKATTSAPTACNTQPWEYIIITR